MVDPEGHVRMVIAGLIRQISLFSIISFFAGLCAYSHDRPLLPGDPQMGLNALINDNMAVGPGLTTLSEKEWDNLWLVFPEKLKQEVLANPGRKHQITAERYGFVLAPEIHVKRPVGFFSNPKKSDKWEMNCMACHAGTVPSPTGPQFVIGAPNNNLDLMGFMQDRIRLAIHYPTRSSFTLQDFVSIPLYKKILNDNPSNLTRGTFNVWRTADIYLNLRNPDLSLNAINLGWLLIGKSVSYGSQPADMDPPTWWNTKFRNRLWIDGFAPKEAKMNALQIMHPENPIGEMEQTFVDVLSFIEQIEAPRYPFPIVTSAAERGRKVFHNKCHHCHGSYENQVVDYPNKTIPLEQLGTDPVRLLTGLSTEYKRAVKDTWVAQGGSGDIRDKADGYMAPPLTGVWASAPYFHNGSVPTLHGVLFPDQRPKIWKANHSRYDEAKGGLLVEEYTREQMASANRSENDSIEKRRYYDTSLNGKSNAGHTFPARLSIEERMDLLEFLKTL